MTDDQILEAFQFISFDSTQGSFLHAFANAVVLADDQNFKLLRPVAVAMIEKYQLPYTPSLKSELWAKCDKCGSDKICCAGVEIGALCVEHCDGVYHHR